MPTPGCGRVPKPLRVVSQRRVLNNWRLALGQTLLKTIRLYHQDKNPIDAHGLEWHFLCREITKQLNGKLELYK